MQPKSSSFLLLICSLLIFLFVYTASSKLLGLKSFQGILTKSPVVGRMAALLAIGIPLLELCIAALLFMPLSRKTGLIGSFLLLAVFTGYIAYMLLTASHLPCSCGGVIASMSWQTHLIFNCCFLTLTGIGICIHQNRAKQNLDTSLTAS